MKFANNKMRVISLPERSHSQKEVKSKSWMTVSMDCFLVSKEQRNVHTIKLQKYCMLNYPTVFVTM